METPEVINHGRRRLLGAAVAAVAAAGMAGCAEKKSGGASATGRTSFGQLKQIDAGVLDVGYAEAGPANGRAVILLHGWPYDIYSYVDIAPILAAKGYRVIVPYLRGHGTTSFLRREPSVTQSRWCSLWTPSP